MVISWCSGNAAPRKLLSSGPPPLRDGGGERTRRDTESEGIYSGSRRNYYPASTDIIHCCLRHLGKVVRVATAINPNSRRRHGNGPQPLVQRQCAREFMARRLSTFRQADVARAVKAAQTAGLAIGSVEVAPDGSIRVIISEGTCSAPATPFDQWKSKHES